MPSFALQNPFSLGLYYPFHNAIDVYYRINNEVSKLNGLPTVMQNTGLALLTILIPLAIVILTEVYKERLNSKKMEIPFVELDLHVILEHVFKVKWLIFFNVMIFLPLAFWELWNNSLDLLLASISAIGVVFTIFIILNVYKWTKGNIFSDIFNFRFAYLKSANICDIVNVWGSIWTNAEMSIINERQFFIIFSSKIDNVLKKKNVSSTELDALGQLSKDFSDSIDKRSVMFLTFDTTFMPKILEWNFSFWKKFKLSLANRVSSNSKALMAFSDWYTVFNNTQKVLTHISQVSVKQNSSYLFLRELKKHSSKYVKEEVTIEKGNIHYYSEALGEIFFPLFFIDRDILENHNLWENVPSEWKVTDVTINQSDNFELKLLLTGFFERFAGDVIQNKVTMGRATAFLFPEIDSSKFATLLLFSYTLDDDKTKAVIERDWKVVQNAWKIHTFTSMDKVDFKAQQKAQDEAETQATYKLVYHFLALREMFSAENLNKYIASAKALTYPKDSKEELHQQRLIEIFNEMLAYLQKVNH
jgi:hypothetical protein